jgi:hypothetical protein
MKIKIQLKDPDGVYDSIKEAARKSVREIKELTEEEQSALEEKRHQDLASKCRKWIEYGEYVTIEIDTETGEAIVLPV